MVPNRLAAGLVAALGEPARQWIAELPALAEKMLRRFELTRDGEPMHGFTALVLPVRGADGTRAVLKLMCPNEEGEHEALALSMWDGAGAVRLLDHDAWVLLLERLNPARTLDHVPLDDAVEVLAGLARRLDRPAPQPVRTLRDLAARWARRLPEENRALGSPVPAELVDRAVRYCAELGPRAGRRLVNEDLHYQNVLAGEREPWLLIDPKPIAGDPEFGLIPLLWNRFGEDDSLERLTRVTRLAGLDLDLARAWTLVRAVDCWLAVAAAPATAFPTMAISASIAAAMTGNR